jgi:hypothetical protein
VVAQDKKTGEIKEIHQVGKKNKNGTPISREKKAIQDIQNSDKGRGINVNYHSYN